jgi:hypothetical protein
MEYQILIDNKDYTQYVSLPLSEQLALDRSLDFGSLKLNYTDIAEPIKPFTDVVIKLIWEDKTKELYYFVSNDNCQEIIQAGRYTHTLLLIEQTKWLERFIGRNHPITQRLFAQQKVMATISKTGLIDRKKELNIKTPLVAGLVYFESVETFFNNLGIDTTGGSLEVYNDGVLFGTFTDNTGINLTTGQWSFAYWSGNITSADTTRVTFYIDVVNENKKPVNKTITSEVNNVLATIETLWVNETPRFIFNEEQAEKYKDVVIPELTLTGTLFEQLSQIGNCIHAMPRLRNGVIYFDEWGSEEITIAQNYWNTKLGDYISNVQSFDIEQYAIAVDSNVDNLVNSDDDNFGSVTEPYTDGFKTVRAESGVVQLKDENVVISTQDPIERVLNVVVGYSNENDFISADISSHVYPTAEYELLSSFSESYPSKAYALKYEVGQKNITGLSFKIPDAISPIFQNYAIQNIINRVNSSASTISSLQKLQFRVTYIPIINGRARQYRNNIKDVSTSTTLAYNQSSQKINARAMGEAMKGAVEKLGNPELTKTYLIPQDLSGYTTAIKAGQKFDDNYYISIIKREYYPEFIKMELGLSKNFNKLNEYVGVDKEIRFYEISEKQVVNTQILYEEFCVIGDELDNYDGNVAVSLNSTAKTLTGKQGEKISSVVAVGSVDGVDLQKVILPVVTYPIGNAVLMTFGYEDNYSAGANINRGTSTFQEYVPYTDIWGEVSNLDITYGQYVKNNEFRYDEVIEEGDALPNADNIDYGEFKTNMNLKVVINKESRAIPTFNYMLHFVTNRNDIVIGEGMAKYFYINGTDTYPINLYVFDNKIGKYDYELQGGTLIGKLNENYTISEKQYIDFGSFVSSVEGKSWAVVKEIDGVKHLLFGQNKNITANSVINLPKLNFTHIIK